MFRSKYPRIIAWELNYGGPSLSHVCLASKQRSTSFSNEIINSVCVFILLYLRFSILNCLLKARFISKHFSSNMSKTSASVSSGVLNTQKQMKARGRRTPDETQSTSFWHDFSITPALQIQCNKTCKNSRLKIQCNANTMQK